MTGDDWLALGDPLAMLERMDRWGIPCYRCSSSAPAPRKPRCTYCQGAWSWRRPSARKLRLLACALCRLVLDRLPDGAAQAVEAAERFAEGRGSAERMREAYGRTVCLIASGASLREVNVTTVHTVAGRVQEKLPPVRGQVETAWHERRVAAVKEAQRTAGRNGREAVKAACQMAALRIDREITAEFERLQRQAKRDVSDALTDVVGHPTDPVAVDAAFLDANGGLVRLIAAGIDESGHFDELPVLADALEEAGCADERILSHARQARHYRGCWLIDAILGKS